MDNAAWSDAGTPIAVGTGEYLPGIAFAGQTNGNAGTRMVIGAAINGVVDGTVASTTLPTGIVFNTSLTNNAGLTERMRISSSGKVGIGAASPQATLDVNGYARLAKNSSQPVACSSTNDGAIALTHVYTLCICNGGTTSWVQSKDGTTACSW